MTARTYIELSERAFRSARVAVVIAALAPLFPSISLFAIRAVYGTTPPIAVFLAMFAAWCLLWGALFISFLWGLQDHERRINRLPAMIYATVLWFASSLVAMILGGITAGMLSVR